MIVLPAAHNRRAEKRVGVRGDLHALHLTMNQAHDKCFDFLIALDKMQIRPHLVGGIAQSYGVDVARNDKRIGTTLRVDVECNGRIERVGKAVGKKSGQFRVAQKPTDFSNGVFNRANVKTTFCERRALADK